MAAAQEAIRLARAAEACGGLAAAAAAAVAAVPGPIIKRAAHGESSWLGAAVLPVYSLLMTGPVVQVMIIPTAAGTAAAVLVAAFRAQLEMVEVPAARAVAAAVEIARAGPAVLVPPDRCGYGPGDMSQFKNFLIRIYLRYKMRRGRW